jgi:hypothetical protein
MSRLALRRGGRVALTVLAASSLATGCRHDAHARQRELTPHQALTALRAELAERSAGLDRPASTAAMHRAQLGELATSGRLLLRSVRIRPEPLDPAILASYLDATAGSAAGDVIQRAHAYHGRRYAVVTRRIESAGGHAWLDVVDTAGSPDLLVPFEVARAEARAEPTGPYRARTIAGFPAVETERLTESFPELVARTLEVEVADRVLVIARGDRRVPQAELARLVDGVDLARLASAVAGLAPVPPGAGEPVSPDRADDG